MKVIGFPGIVLTRDGIGRDTILPPCVISLLQIVTMGTSALELACQ